MSENSNMNLFYMQWLGTTVCFYHFNASPWGLGVGIVFWSTTRAKGVNSKMMPYLHTRGSQSNPAKSCHWGPSIYDLVIEILWKFFLLWFYSYHLIRSQFCTCHGSWAVMTCANLLSDLMIIDLRTAQVYCDWIFLVSQEVSLNFHRCCG